MSFQFHETGYGKRFFEYQMPMLIQALTRIADCMTVERRPQPNLKCEPSTETGDGSTQQYRLDIAEVHYGSAHVKATCKQQALNLAQTMIDEGEVFWNKTELGNVTVTQEPQDTQSV